jgi:hypothetical protein
VQIVLSERVVSFDPDACFHAGAVVPLAWKPNGTDDAGVSSRALDRRIDGHLREVDLLNRGGVQAT